MGKLLLTGVDGNLGNQAAEYLLELEPVENLIFCGYSQAALQKVRGHGRGNSCDQFQLFRRAAGGLFRR